MGILTGAAAGWCNGSTTGSGPVSEGSNPSPAAKFYCPALLASGYLTPARVRPKPRRGYRRDNAAPAAATLRAGRRSLHRQRQCGGAGPSALPSAPGSSACSGRRRHRLGAGEARQVVLSATRSTRAVLAVSCGSCGWCMSGYASGELSARGPKGTAARPLCGSMIAGSRRSPLR